MAVQMKTEIFNQNLGKVSDLKVGELSFSFLTSYEDWEGKVDKLFFSAEWVGTHKRVCAHRA